MEEDSKKTYYQLGVSGQEIEYTIPGYQQLKDFILEKEKRIDSELTTLKEGNKELKSRLEKVEDRKYDIIKTIALAIITFFLGFFLNVIINIINK